MSGCFRFIVASILIGIPSVVFGQGQSNNKCGAECLYVSLRTLGKAPKLYTELLAKMGSPGKSSGYSFQEIEAGAKHFGCQTASIEIASENLVTLRDLAKSYEVIVLVKGSHFMNCSVVGEDIVTLIDLSKGTSRVDIPTFLQDWDGKCVIISTSAINLQVGTPRNYFSWAVRAIGVVGLCGGIAWISLFLIRKTRRKVAVVVFILGLSILNVGCDSAPQVETTRNELVDLRDSLEPHLTLLTPSEFTETSK